MNELVGSHSPAPDESSWVIRAIEWALRVSRNIRLPVVYATCVSLVIALGVIDYLTGPRLSFSILYLIPITFAALARRGVTAYGISILSALVWLVADVESRAMPLPWTLHFWNTLVRLGFFSLHTAVTTGLATMILRERGLSQMDPLTGALNWRGFKDLAQHPVGFLSKGVGPVTLAYLDLDNFKQVNDNQGHEAGDQALAAISEKARELLRKSDAIARVGGDEFLIMLTGADGEEALDILSRFMEGLEEEMQSRKLPITFSVGAATFRNPTEPLESMIRQVDGMMYEVKRSGKNGLKHEIR